MNNKKQKIIVGMSGGIDSSVTAYLLQKEGYEVEGVYMKLHETVRGYHEANLESIEKVSNFLGIKYSVLDLTTQFKEEVYDYFVQSYIDGVTPNPCVKCNRTIKFGALMNEAMRLGGDFLATGHYAKTDGEFVYCATDLTKDQSYFLAQIDKSILPKVMFPMSVYTKEQIKEIGSKIPALKEISQKKESQEICFVDTVYTDILSKHTNIDLKGKTLSKDGKEIGHHKGYMHYTVGKRKGFYVHGAHEPHFVISQDKANNTITVGKQEDLIINKVIINNLNMFIGDLNFTATIKLRYRSRAIEASVEIKDDKACIILKESAYGVAIGQVAVFYDEDKVLGSGIITETFQ
ncbi:MAG TPA: tRNA 2-thiouridine(34) synthase MnmA [Arcobacter sp.]|nr:tRNA 2-thiouridine(34) synthase MnmA [Arcobacter sp.]